jgi:hypothetical protein
MTLLSVDDLLAAQLGRRPEFVYKCLQTQPSTGRLVSTWGLPGIPGAAAFDTTMNGVTLSSASSLVPGQIPFYNAPIGKISRLSRVLFGSHLGGGQAMLLDRLWHNQITSVTSTSLQAITSPTWPARDVNGSTDGDGVYIFLELSAAVGASAPALTLTYTNSAGVSGRTAVPIHVLVASANVGVMWMFGLQAGDLGVRSVQGIQFGSSWVSGTAHLSACRIVQMLGVPPGGAVDEKTGANFGLPKMYDGSVPFFALYSNGNSSNTLHCGLMNTSVD